MALLAAALVAFVAFEHVVFFVLESLLWTKPIGRKIFGQSEEQAAHTAPLALNQGVYNTFLAAGLIWGLLAGPPLGFTVKIFFLTCVIIAGLVGAVTAKRSILFVQALPAAVALLLVCLSR